jgi:hypothetical protein
MPQGSNAGPVAKQTPHERRKGESALSDFADYVEKQQAHRTAGGAAQEEHAELDILDSLDLVDSIDRVRLKDLLLSKPPDPGDASEDANLVKLRDVVNGRIEEGNGETLFELGVENNGESMGFNKVDWEYALGRLRAAAKGLTADVTVLLTKGVGGDEEGESTLAEKAKDKGDIGVNGKVMIRRKPATAEDVIETRIAVVGNGSSSPSEAWMSSGADILLQSTQASPLCSVSWSRAT